MRRRGRLRLVGVAACVAAFVVVGAEGMTRLSDHPASVASPSDTTTASDVPFPAPASRALAVGHSAGMRVFLHCGLRYATIDGTTWETAAQGDGPAPAGLPDMVTGTATRSETDTVVFTTSVPASITWVFHPATTTDGAACF